MRLKPGQQAPDFSLQGTDKKTYSLASFKGKKAFVVIFTCNHCPYAKAWTQRIIDVQNDFPQVQVIAINSNDDKNYPEDSFFRMIEVAKEKGFPFPYLRDETQEVAKKYGAEVTPDCFVLDPDHVVHYTGRVDDNYENPKAVKSQDLRNAIKALLEGKGPPVKEVRAIGCSIKWKN